MRAPGRSMVNANGNDAQKALVDDCKVQKAPTKRASGDHLRNEKGTSDIDKPGGASQLGGLNVEVGNEDERKPGKMDHVSDLRKPDDIADAAVTG